MARIIPSDLTELALQGAHEPEIETLGYLKQSLPESYDVFHGVHWTRQHRGATVYGEIDFVVLNGSGDALLIEQKNGPVVERDGALVKQYSDGEKDVARQLHRSLDSVRDKFKFVHGNKSKLELEYLIYCPEASLKKLSAVGIDDQRVVDSRGKDNLASQIQALLPYSEGARSPFGEKVYEFFRQSFEVVPDIHAHIGAQETNFTRLSGGLVETLSNLEMAPLRLRVYATAGNGKTYVARHFYDQAIREGKRPLLLCFNRPLAERLKHQTTNGGMVDTWYGFLDQFLKQHGVTLQFSEMGTNPGFWDDALALVQDAVLSDQASDSWRFDSLIIDEAQDFETRWFDTARLFLSESPDILWLEDPNQNLRSTDPISLDEHGFVGYRSLVNFRSPYSIARYIRKVLPEFEFTAGNDLPGLGVGVSTYEESEDQPKIVGRLVGRLLSQRFRPQDIAIISLKGLNSTALREASRVGNHTIRRFTGDYDLLGNQVMTKGQITFDTIRRFKGQQSPVVILVDVDPDIGELTQSLQLLFCGMTRATVRLELVCNGSNDWVNEHVESQ